ncbi:uncharacterized protein N7529_011660 [Penicillium soppii]|uniref:uncharacterized protein n=1 Tax=Penicillium soppii TaxID=69789 RepID=UPI0025478C01|nr:uncharacterized protein N7529_011660 [Penicillium soppii]KAJ5852275.1 hypothetical protein N7529_011660 [Penicillium soppii]
MNKHNFAAPKPAVASSGPTGAILLELLIISGAPFKDHWAYWVRSQADPDIGVKIPVTGNVRKGFEFEIKRSENLQTTEDIPTMRVPLQWVDAKNFDEIAMLNNGKYKIDNHPVCLFEAIAHKIEAPGKSLSSVDNQFQI